MERTAFGAITRAALVAAAVTALSGAAWAQSNSDSTPNRLGGPAVPGTSPGVTGQSGRLDCGMGSLDPRCAPPGPAQRAPSDYPPGAVPAPNSGASSGSSGAVGGSGAGSAPSERSGNVDPKSQVPRYDR
ncbi:MAG: hypothetical protein ACM30I_08035 [Gemmatimonas sp.]